MARSARIFVSMLCIVAGTAFSATRSDINLNGRTAMVYVPNGHKNSPLVISMHGMGIPASMNQGMMRFEKYADTAKERFITVYPQGVDSRWDIGGDRDVNFILAIIDEMFKKYAIDKNRVYVSGFSMGGMMSWYLTCKIPDKIAAAVPGNGFPLGGMSGCSDKRRVPVLHIHGTADDFVKYSQYVGSFGPAQVTRYGCSTPVRVKPYPVDKPTSQSFMDTWANCDKNGLKSELHLLHVTGMIHDWATPGKANANDDPKFKGKPFDVDGTHEAWNFMKRHSLTGSAGLADAPRLRRPELSVRASEGRFQVASDLPLREVRILDLQGRTQARWSATGPSDNLATFAAGALRSGVHTVEARGDAGRTVARVLVP